MPSCSVGARYGHQCVVPTLLGHSQCCFYTALLLPKFGLLWLCTMSKTYLAFIVETEARSAHPVGYFHLGLVLEFEIWRLNGG